MSGMGWTLTAAELRRCYTVETCHEDEQDEGMANDPNDERAFTRRECRLNAISSTQFADHAAEQDPPDWENVTYWQRDALIQALLALSARED